MNDSKAYSPGQLLLKLEQEGVPNKRHVTDYVWQIKQKEWQSEKKYWMEQMNHNITWGLPKINKIDVKSNMSGVTTTATDIRDLSFMSFAMSRATIKDTSNSKSNEDENQDSKQISTRLLKMMSETVGEMPKEKKAKKTEISNRDDWRTLGMPSKKPHRAGQQIFKKRIHHKMSRVMLRKFLEEWDLTPSVSRNKLLEEFNRKYKTKEVVYDANEFFAHGSSLIFIRMAASFQLNFLRKAKVWPDFKAMMFFIQSMQGDEFSEIFIRMGALDDIFETVRSDKHNSKDKRYALKLLIAMMKTQSSIITKSYICDNNQLLESLVDYLTICKDKKLIQCCGIIFEELCIETVPENVKKIARFLLHVLPCDFNPLIQEMGFKGLQSVVRLQPKLGHKCLRYIQDSLKTTKTSLLTELAKLCRVILNGPHADDLINILFHAASGMRLKEKYQSGTYNAGLVKKRENIRDHGHHTEEHRRNLERRDIARSRAIKLDPYKSQAGAMFVMNYAMTSEPKLIHHFISKGIFGLALKTTGTCPHYEVQGQGVTMLIFLHEVSIECAISMYIILPERMILILMEEPNSCLRHFTSPICIQLRKLGRFCLQYWQEWTEKVVTPAKMFSEGHKIPDDVRGLCAMAQSATRCRKILQGLIENPVMESLPRSPGRSVMGSGDSFFDSSEDESRQFQITDGELNATMSKRYNICRKILQLQYHTVSEDSLDVRMAAKATAAKGGIEGEELGAMELVMLKDAEKAMKTAEEEDEAEETDQGAQGANDGDNADMFQDVSD